MRTFSLITKDISLAESHKLKTGLKYLLLQGKVVFQTALEEGIIPVCSTLLVKSSLQKLKEGWSVLSANKQTYLRHKTRAADVLQQLSAGWN